MEEKFSRILFSLQLASASILRQYLDITNFFAVTGYMNPLAVKFNHMINQTENNELYTVWNFQSVYCASSRSHGKIVRGETYFTSRRLHTPDLTTWENTAHSYIYFIRVHIIKWCKTTEFSFDLVGMHLNKLHKIPPRALHIRLHPCTNIHKNTPPHTYMHQTLSDTHHTSLLLCISVK